MATTTFAALVAVVDGGSVFAAGANATIAGNGFSPAVIKVVSENGTSWTKIEERPLALPVTLHIQMDGFKVHSYSVHQAGQPAGQFMEQHVGTVDSVDASPTLIGFTQNMTAAERQAVLDGCNARLDHGNGIRDTHNIFTGVGVVLTASFMSSQWDGKIDTGGLGAPHVANGSVTVPVQCEGIKPGAKDRAPAAGVTTLPPDFKVGEINLRFMTSAGYVTQPDPGTRCKLTQVRVRVGTTKAGPTKVKLWTKVGAEPMKSEVVDAWSKFVGPGKFEATFTKALPVKKTSSVQAMAEEMVNPIGLTTPWKSITVHCTGAGGGGLAGTPGNANPDASLPRPPVVRPPFAGRPGGLVVRPHPTHDAVPPRGLGKLRGDARPAFAAERFQRTKVHVR